MPQFITYEQLSGQMGTSFEYVKLGFNLIPNWKAIRHGNNLEVFGGDGVSRVRLTPESKGHMGWEEYKVWYQPDPSEFHDPIRRVLARRYLPQRLLVVSDEPVTSIELPQILGNSKISDTMVGIIGAFQVTGGQAIATLEFKQLKGDWCGRYVLKSIIVRPGADKIEVAAWLDVLLGDKFERWLIMNAQQQGHLSSRTKEFIARLIPQVRIILENGASNPHSYQGHTYTIAGWVTSELALVDIRRDGHQISLKEADECGLLKDWFVFLVKNGARV